MRRIGEILGTCPHGVHILEQLEITITVKPALPW